MERENSKIKLIYGGSEASKLMQQSDAEVIPWRNI